MFCSQCEQTTRGEGCFQWGACGKSPDVDALQDLLTHCLRGLSEVVLRARQLNIPCREADVLTCEMVFSTLTNVNFDADDFVKYVRNTVALRDRLKAQVEFIDPSARWSNLAAFILAATQAELVQQGRDLELEFISNSAGDVDRFSLKLIVLYGLKGLAAYTNYYTELVEKIPDDCVVLTLGCGKFRFFDKNLGTIGELPRLMDVGQCNDAYSAIQIAVALANAFNTDVNHLPLSMILSWYEQKAVSVLLTLLYLGIQNIRLGPILPAFISPNVLKLLSQKYNLKAITTPDADLAACLV